MVGVRAVSPHVTLRYFVPAVSPVSTTFLASAPADTLVSPVVKLEVGGVVFR